MTAARFVILHHRERTGEHWDLMIEQDDGLATWRLARMPSADDAAPIAATQLGLHRKAYLDYEGPVSGDRGEVTRVDAGACEILEQNERCWRVRLMGRTLAYTYALRRHDTVDPNGWTLMSA